MMRRWDVVCGLVLPLLVACSSDDDDGNGAAMGGASSSSGGTSATGGKSGTSGGSSTGGSGDGGGASGTVTWAEDIAPLVFRECIACHRDGGIGPFALTDYETAFAMSLGMATATREREMPPMPVDNSGSCNTFENARWLTDDEIDLFQAWVDAGAPEGDPALTPELPPPPEGLTGVDVTVSPSEDYVPNAALSDDYRCFLVEPGLSATRFIVAYEVIPGDSREVHHAILFAPKDAAAQAEAEAKDAAESGLGYTCFGGTGVDAEPRALWAPGVEVVTLPAGTGLPLAAGRKLILQIHYNTHAGAFPDRTTVRMRTAPTVAKAAKYQPVADQDMNVAPGQELGVTSAVHQVTPQPVIVYGAAPHMHTLGRTLRVDMGTNAGSRCLVNVDRWDFHWQNAWWYTTPIQVQQLTGLTISCGYDTTSRTTPVVWGEGTDDEMCLSYLYMTGP